MNDHAGDASSSETTGTSTRSWLYLGAAVLALMLIGLGDRIVEEPAPGDRVVPIDPTSARHAESSGNERAAKVDVIDRGAMRQQ